MNDQLAKLSRRRLALESRLAVATGATADALRREIEAVNEEAMRANGGAFVSVGARVVAAQAKGGKRVVKKRPTQAKMLIDLAQARYDVIEDQHGQAFAVPKKPPRVAVVLRGKGQSLTNRLRSDYFDHYASLPTGANVTGVVDLLESRASKGERVPIHVRCVRTAEGLVIDLGDPEGRVAIVKEGGWKIAAVPPSGVLFRRTRMTGALPNPARGGSLNELRQLINVSDESWDLVRAWLVLAWMPHIPVPILCVTGHQGAGKSVLGRALVSLVDPSSAPLRSMPHNLGEWQTTAAASRVVGLDNISRIKEEMSDAMCRATTGEGAAKRQLYTDEDLIVQSYRRALLLTSIDPGALKGDLGERLMPVELLRPSRRRGEEELDALLEAHRPRILGALLDLAAEVLAIPAKAPNPPRMADAANVMAAVDRATGGASLAAYIRGQENVAETVLEGEPVAMAVLSLMEGRAEWSGTPTKLYNELLLRWDPDWRNRPATVKGMSERLKRMTPQLREVYALEVAASRPGPRVIEMRWIVKGETNGERIVRRRRARAGG